MNLHLLFQQTLDRDQNAFANLREAVITLRAQGLAKDAILDALQSFRGHVHSEADEDIVLEVMDCLVGFCSPHMRID